MKLTTEENILNQLITLVVIPARLDSTRFPGKVLHPLLHKPMIQWVYENAVAAKRVTEVLVATDDPSVLSAVESFGGRAILTPKGFESGTDRVAWAVQNYPPARACSLVVNVQADEPLLPATAIDDLIAGLQHNPAWEIATLAVSSLTADLQPDLLSDSNVVKVVVADSGMALYFSRQPLRQTDDAGKGVFLKHVGIYAYRRSALERYCRLPVSSLERCERLEQLRALQHGMPIGIVLMAEDTLAVDVPGDVAKVEKRMMRGRFHFSES